MPPSLGISREKTYRKGVGLWSGEERNKMENVSLLVERFTVFS